MAASSYPGARHEPRRSLGMLARIRRPPRRPRRAPRAPARGRPGGVGGLVVPGGRARPPAKPAPSPPKPQARGAAPAAPRATGRPAPWSDMTASTGTHTLSTPTGEADFKVADLSLAGF